MAEISIPGVSDKYKTNDYIEALMQKERIPLNYEQESLDRYKEQQNAWRDVNQKMSSLRESSRTLYSFENPFNNKLASSSDENAITATAGRDASYDTYKVDVVKEATADKFLSMELEKNSAVPSGKYTFQVADKTVSFNWKGGKLNDFITALNKRGNGTIKASLIGVSGNKNALMIESLKTGVENSLVFKDDALAYALENRMVEKNQNGLTAFGLSLEEFGNPDAEDVVPENDQVGMPKFLAKSISIVRGDAEKDSRIVIPPRGGLEIFIGEELLPSPFGKIEFSYSVSEVADITDELNEQRNTRPELPNSGSVSFGQLSIFNESSETALPPLSETSLEPITGEIDFL